MLESLEKRVGVAAVMLGIGLALGCSAPAPDEPEPVAQVAQALVCTCAGTSETCPANTACLTQVCEPCCGPNCFECAGKPAAFNTQCDDGNACTTGDFCDGQGNCKAGTTAVVCNDGNPCTVDTCDPKTGCKYTPAPTTTSCNDGNPCTINDRCDGTGKCVGGGNLNCDDGKSCTSDSCVPAQGGCVHTALTGAACNDGNPCTTGDTCTSTGACAGSGTLSCDDGNPCTADSCDPSVSGGCVYTNEVNKPCSDNNVCTQNDMCQAGSCKPGTAIVCNDNNPCTVDTCNANSGCVYTNQPTGTTCDDGNACSTGDQCNANGVCAGTGGLNCNDNNPCTKNTCSGGICQYPNEPNGTACDDGNKCTVSDSCVGGQCTGTGAPNCDDNNPCTNDSCSPATGCTYVNADGKACDDQNPCTLNDVCGGGVCKPGNALQCPATDECHDAGSCDQQSGSCTNPVKQDGSPCTGGKCQSGVCILDADGGSGGNAGTSGNAGTGATGGGSAGTGGSGAASGGAGASGASGAGGSSGSGGGAAGAGGGAGSDAGEPIFEPDPAGCKCKSVGSRGERSHATWLALGALGVAAARRRRRASVARIS
jgi:MYXO-CTERM domain-containing protein